MSFYLQMEGGHLSQGRCISRFIETKRKFRASLVHWPFLKQLEFKIINTPLSPILGWPVLIPNTTLLRGQWAVPGNIFGFTAGGGGGTPGIWWVEVRDAVQHLIIEQDAQQRVTSSHMLGVQTLTNATLENPKLWTMDIKFGKVWWCCRGYLG